MFTLNGIGTALYGKSEIKTDGSYIATEWFVLLFLPIFPLASYRVLSKNAGGFTIGVASGAKTKYSMMNVPLNRKQVFLTYSCVYGLLSVIFIGFFMSIHFSGGDLTHLFDMFGCVGIFCDF